MHVQVITKGAMQTFFATSFIERQTHLWRCNSTSEHERPAATRRCPNASVTNRGDGVGGDSGQCECSESGVYYPLGVEARRRCCSARQKRQRRRGR